MRLFMKRIIAVISALLCCVLSSCYTQVNQRWLEPYKTYEVRELAEVKPAQAKDASALYRCGDTWYVSAQSGTYIAKVPRPFRFEEYLQPIPAIGRGIGIPLTRTQDAPRMIYHRLTPEAARLIQKGPMWTPRQMRSALRQAGGSWQAELPPGAVKVMSFGEGGRVAPYSERHVKNCRAPWYAYMASGLTLVCVDTPLTVAGNVALLGTFPLWLPISVVMARPVHAPSSAK